MAKPFDNPHEHPSADLSQVDAKAYEDTVVTLLREALKPGLAAPSLVRSIELEGERPDTVVVLRYHDRGRPERMMEARAPIWDEEDWRYNAKGREYLGSPASVGGFIYSAFTAGDLSDQLCEVGVTTTAL